MLRPGDYIKVQVDYSREADRLYGIQFHWAGFTAMGYDLHQQGWEISIQQDNGYQSPHTTAVQFALKNPQQRVYGLSHFLTHHRGMVAGPRMDVEIGYIATDLSIPSGMGHRYSWDPIECFSHSYLSKQMHEAEQETNDIRNVVPFRPIGGKEIWIEKKDVGQALEQILLVQAPKQKEIRERARKAEAPGQRIAQLLAV